MPRAPRPDDLFRLRIASEPRLSADGRLVALTLQTVAPGFDGYRDALWLVATDGSSAPRQVTLGARHDRHPRFSPDGRTLAFISDRRDLLDEPVTRSRTSQPGSASGGASQPDREDRNQVFALPLDGGEARQVTDLPRGVTAFEWSPDGTRLVVVSSSHGATRAEDDRLPRDRPQAGSDCPAALGLSLHRSTRVEAQRARLHLRPGHAPVARRDRRGRSGRQSRPGRQSGQSPGDPPDRRARIGWRTRLVARRPVDRLRVQPPSRRRHPLPPSGHPRRRCRDSRRDRDHQRAAIRLHRPDVAPGRIGHRRARASPAGRSGESQRHLAAQPGWLRRDPEWWPQPVGTARPDARVQHEQRRDARRGNGAHPVGPRSLARSSAPRSMGRSSSGASASRTAGSNA